MESGDLHTALFPTPSPPSSRTPKAKKNTPSPPSSAESMASSMAMSMSVLPQLFAPSPSGMSNAGHLTDKLKVSILHSITCGMEYLHRHGILHCDLKPRN